MRRYGDNVSKEDLMASKPASGNPDTARVMFGGCGYGAGSFKRPPPVSKRPHFDLLALLGFKRSKARKD